ncbi:sensor histidine kinase [Neptunicella marina]|uniref:histidine kinase n=1 Tax=Neptunicella marina TaxID=2125989 RepID=A0A8J6ISW6_9ALTE|nr:ATP-binding protein [Neptunicella marina]MBC3765003.1 PAS domain-containing protein [Neptunicella marina]
MAVAQLVINPTSQPDEVTFNQQEFIRLQQQSDRLSHLLEVMPAGVVVIDGQGNVKQANQVAIDLLGEPLEGESWRAIIQRSFRPQADDGHEVSLYDGRKVKLSICPLEKEPGQLIVLTDLTETRRLQQRVSHMQRLSSLGNMVASLAHQIRTPLSAALLYASNIASHKLDEVSRSKFSEKLLSRLHDLEHQVNDMLLFAKSGSDQVVNELSMQSLLEEVQAGTDAMLTQHQATMHVTMPEPDIFVLANRTALAGALQNLIHNSVQIKNSGAHIHVAARRDEADPQTVLLSVTDNGPGIDPHKVEHLFEPFYTTRSQGTGLGLAVVKAVAQSHKGSVEVANTPQGGACFCMKLPIHIFEQNNPSLQQESTL